MMTKKTDDATDKTRKRKRSIPTRAAGAPVNSAFQNPADDLFAEAFAARGGTTKDISSQLLELSEQMEIITDITQSSSDGLPTADAHPNTDGAPKQTGTSILTGHPKTTGPPTQTGIGSKSLISRKPQSHPVSPERDYTKTPNSVTRIVLAQGLFKGKSKQIYDYLWSISRGAIKPDRIARKTKKEIMQGTGIGSKNTVASGINHLQSIQLIKVLTTAGSNEGNEYEVFTPDELGYTTPEGLPNLTGVPIEPGQTTKNGAPSFDWATRAAQKVGVLGLPISGSPSMGQTQENKIAYTVSKTFLKTLKQIDDETALIRAFEKLDEAARTATGSGLTKSDLEAFENIIDLLIDMTTIAATKTDSVTTYLKFAEANLKKRLATAQRIFEKKPTKPFEPGSPPTGELQLDTESTFEAEPLTEEQRENALVIYRPLFQEKGTEALENGRWQFTTEDYEWLLEKLTQ
jgi:hypothetical protein